MFLSTITLVLLSVLYVLGWHDKSPRQPVLTRRNYR
jgi:hypothetical protein